MSATVTDEAGNTSPCSAGISHTRAAAPTPDPAPATQVGEPTVLAPPCGAPPRTSKPGLRLRAALDGRRLLVRADVRGRIGRVRVTLWPPCGAPRTYSVRNVRAQTGRVTRTITIPVAASGTVVTVGVRNGARTAVTTVVVP